MTDTTFFTNLFEFTRLLRDAGISISLGQKMDFVRSLEMIDIGSRSQVYHAARSLLVTRREEIPIFDQVFNAFWTAPDAANDRGRPGQKTPRAPRHDTKRKKLSIATIMAQRSRPEDPEVEIADRAGSFSAIESLKQKDFSNMTEEELERIRRLILSMRWRISERQTRRLVPDKSGGKINMRRVLREAAKHGGTPIHLAWQDRKIKPRPLIVIADISGSMERYSRLLLQFAYCMAQSFSTLESFVFATRLTHITPYLRIKNIDSAIDQAGKSVVDWSSGTRIGESLQSFNREWSRRVLRRGAVVMIISDGWERGDCSVLAQEMRYLHHRCHRLIWLNPLMGDMAYQPMVEGMQAALPHIDDFLPIHNLDSLERLSRHLANLHR